MTDETKRGSNGGNARAEKLSKEQRSAIAKEAAKARWAKKKQPEPEVSQGVSGINQIQIIDHPPEPTMLLPAPVSNPAEKPQKPRKRTPMPKAFGAANSYAEKRLADAIRERAEAMGRVAALNAEIPSLVQIINALKSTSTIINPQAYQTVDPAAYASPPSPPPYPQGVPLVQYTPTQTIPPVPMAHGGAIGGPITEPQELPEDYFLRDTVVGGKFI